MKGRAAITRDTARSMELTEYDVPDPGPDEVLVEVSLAGICGSDLHMWRGEVPWFQKAPGIQGHEMSGRVAKLGANRANDSLGRPLREGDRVAYAYFIPCGECWACLGGTSGCPNRYRTRRSEEHMSELQSRQYLVCRLLLEKKNKRQPCYHHDLSHVT